MKSALNYNKYYAGNAEVLNVHSSCKRFSSFSKIFFKINYQCTGKICTSIAPRVWK